VAGVVRDQKKASRSRTPGGRPPGGGGPGGPGGTGGSGRSGGPGGIGGSGRSGGSGGDGGSRGTGRASLAISKDRLATVIAGAVVLAILTGVGIILLSFGSKAYHYVVDKDRLYVDEVEVEGLVVLTRDEILQLAGIKKNAPILELDLRAAATRVMKHPRVGSAVVARHLPRRVVINVAERIPIGLVQESGVIKGIDASGKIVPLIPAREEVKGPIITGNFHQAAAEVKGEALSVLELLRPDLIARISELRLDAAGGITLLTTGEPVVIRMGRGEMPRKIERLRAAMKQFEETGQQKEYIDVRFTDIVTRP
jgi:cell division protein FtsQ